MGEKIATAEGGTRRKEPIEGENTAGGRDQSEGANGSKDHHRRGWIEPRIANERKDHHRRGWDKTETANGRRRPPEAANGMRERSWKTSGVDRKREGALVTSRWWRTRSGRPCRKERRVRRSGRRNGRERTTGRVSGSCGAGAVGLEDWDVWGWRPEMCGAGGLGCVGLWGWRPGMCEAGGLGCVGLEA